MIFGDKINYPKAMNVSESASRPGVNPDHFPFSALHFIRTYNRLLSPAGNYFLILELIQKLINCFVKKSHNATIYRVLETIQCH